MNQPLPSYARGGIARGASPLADSLRKAPVRNIRDVIAAHSAGLRPGYKPGDVIAETTVNVATHPNHAASLEARKQELADKASVMELCNAWMAKLGLSVQHIRNHTDRFKGGLTVDPKGGVTVAYRCSANYLGKVNKSTVIELATSVCSPEDSYDKDYGRALAVRNFVMGRHIMMPIAKHMTVDLALKRAFATVYYCE